MVKDTFRRVVGKMDREAVEGFVAEWIDSHPDDRCAPEYFFYLAYYGYIRDNKKKFFERRDRRRFIKHGCKKLNQVVNSSFTGGAVKFGTEADVIYVNFLDLASE